MRAAQVALLSSIAHAPLLLYIADLATPPPRQHLRAWPIPIVAAPPPAPIEVAFLVEDPASGVEPRLGASGAASIRQLTRSRGTTTASEVGSGSETAPAADSGTSSLLRMRGPDLGLDPGVAARIAEAGSEQHDELRTSGKLKSQPGGRAVVHDRVTTMTVDADGKVRFHDKKDIDLELKMPVPKLWEIEELRKDLGHELTEWFKDPEAGSRFRPSSDLPRHLQASQGACDQWGAELCDDPLAPKIEQRVRERRKVNGAFYGGPADATAWLYRKFVGDPYASRKLKLLADTLDERVAMGEAHRAQQSARSSEYMRKNLERLWAREDNPVARRAALFELWDECSDDDAGTRARAIVIGWIRTHLPAGSEHAYTDEELAALQQRKTSRLPFAPYPDGASTISR